MSSAHRGSDKAIRVGQVIALLLVVVFALGVQAGCSHEPDATPSGTSSKAASGDTLSKDESSEGVQSPEDSGQDALSAEGEETFAFGGPASIKTDELDARTGVYLGALFSVSDESVDSLDISVSSGELCLYTEQRQDGPMSWQEWTESLEQGEISAEEAQTLLAVDLDAARQASREALGNPENYRDLGTLTRELTHVAGGASRLGSDVTVRFDEGFDRDTVWIGLWADCAGAAGQGLSGEEAVDALIEDVFEGATLDITAHYAGGASEHFSYMLAVGNLRTEESSPGGIIVQPLLAEGEEPYLYTVYAVPR